MDEKAYTYAEFVETFCDGDPSMLQAWRDASMVKNLLDSGVPQLMTTAEYHEVLSAVRRWLIAHAIGTFEKPKGDRHAQA